MDWTQTALLALGVTGLGGVVVLFISWLRGRESAARRVGADETRRSDNARRESISVAIAERDRVAHRRSIRRAKEIQDEAARKQEALRRKLEDDLSKPVDDGELTRLIEIARARRDLNSESNSGAAKTERGDE